MTNTILLFCTLFSLASAAPRILNLNKYSTGGEFIADGIEDGAKLYVASNDDSSVLRNITIKTGSVSVTADQLADYYTDGTPKYLNITGGLAIKTLNPDRISNALTGYIYVTTYQQAYVYVITGNHTISRDGMKTTSVVLNIELNDYDSLDLDKPTKTSYVTNIDHSSNTNLYFMWGIPDSNWNVDNNNTFFENPVNFLDYDYGLSKFVESKVFFNNVEPMQVNLDCWYFVSMGPVNMQLERKYVSAHNYTTTSVNTTGLIMNNWFYKDHQVNFLLDQTRNRTVGNLISTYLTKPVTFLLDGPTNTFSETYSTDIYKMMLKQYFQANRLMINTTSLFPGTFYCQYFGFSTNLLRNVPSTAGPVTRASTNTPMVTTPTVATTTKFAKDRSMINLTVIILAAVLLR